MTIRPIDMQINIMKENDNAKLAQKDRIHNEGQAHFSQQIQKEQNDKDNTVKDIDHKDESLIQDNAKGGQEYQGNSEKKEKSEEKNKDRVEVKDPNLGNKIDIKF